MNPFSLDHIFHRSSNISRTNMRNTCYPAAASLRHDPCASRNLSASLQSLTQHLFGAIQEMPPFVHPSLELSKNMAVVFNGDRYSIFGCGDTRRSWAWLELN